MNDKFFLITPAPTSHRTAEENLGISYLKSILLLNNFNVEVRDGWLENLTTENLIEIILNDSQIRILGISCYRSNMQQAIKILTKVREYREDIIFIAGGYGPTFYSEDFLNSGFDIVVIGEAENTIVELANYFIYNDRKLNEIDGISYIEKGKRVITTPRKLVQNIDEIPFPDRSYIAEILKRKSLINVITSRGCLANCIFCSIVAFQKISKKSPKWRERSIKNIVQEIEILYNKGVEYIKIIDDSLIEFPRDVKWCKELSENINNRNLNVQMRGSIRADRVSDEIILYLKRAGFFSFSCGIESGSPTMLKRMGKSATLEDNLKALEVFKNHNILVQAGYILFDPFTTIQELEESYSFMRNNLNMISKGVFTEMYAASGTPFNNLLSKRNLVESNFEDHGNSTYNLVDDKARLVYKALKYWHKRNSYLYDKTIDPISAPKAISKTLRESFFKLYLELRLSDLDFFREVLDLVQIENCTEIILITIVDERYDSLNKWRKEFIIKVDNNYSLAGLNYNADLNPFIC